LQSRERISCYLTGKIQVKSKLGDDNSKTTAGMTQRVVYLKQNFGWPDQPSSGFDVTKL